MPPSYEMDPDARLESIPEDAIFDDWSVIKEFTQRSVFPIELKGISSMGFDDL